MSSTVFDQLTANELKEVLIPFFLNNFRMCLQIINITQKKLALKLIQDFSPCFGPAIRGLSAVINRIFI